MITITNIANINSVLSRNKISTITANCVSFDDWMRKIQNIHLSDHEAMCAAYERVMAYNISLPLVRNIKHKYGVNL